MGSDAFFLMIGSLVLYWNGIMIALGIAVGTYYAFRTCKTRYGGNGSNILISVIVAILPALFLGRLYYCYSFGTMDGLLDFSLGGIGLPGAIAGGLIAVFVVGKAMRASVGELLDGIAPGAALSISIGRWGALFTGENQGGVVSAAMQGAPYSAYNAVEGAWHSQLFFYESVVTLCVFALLVLIQAQKTRGKLHPRNGDIALLFLICYPILQGLFELNRQDALIFNTSDIIKAIPATRAVMQKLQTVSLTMPIGVLCAAIAVAILLIRQFKRRETRTKAIVTVPICAVLCVMHFLTVLRIEIVNQFVSWSIVVLGGLGLIAVGLLTFRDLAKADNVPSEPVYVTESRPKPMPRTKNEPSPRNRPEQTGDLYDPYDVYDRKNDRPQRPSAEYTPELPRKPKPADEPELDFLADLPGTKKPKPSKKKRGLDDWNP